MPTYDYTCNACNHLFELYQHITEKPIKKCPSCGRLKAQRMIGTGSAIIFKGSGFYQTDYRSEEYKTKARKESEGAKPEAKTESKPEVKAETKTEAKRETKTETKKESKAETKNKK
ncbi:MAG: zinc ribbon domain-containing protein [Planctomycetota bacterium]